MCELGPRHIATLTVGSTVPSVGDLIFKDVCMQLSKHKFGLNKQLRKLGHMHTNILESREFGEAVGEVVN